MIPRLKPYISIEELFALFSAIPHAVEKFEEEFCRTFKVKYAIAFSYGRSALWAFFKAMGIRGAEIVQPAYTCSVVGHATVLSGNIPCFVDCTLQDYNMDLGHFERSISERTRAVIPTHVFGTPMDIRQLKEIVNSAEKRFGHRIYIIQDCAHSFEAEWQGVSVINTGDGALFGLGISKQITSIFGGMFTTNDPEIAQKLNTFREQEFEEKTVFEKLRRTVYLPAALAAFDRSIYGLTYWLQQKTSLLKNLTDAYHLDQKIHFPPDYKRLLSKVEARVGISQIKKYPRIKSRRREIAAYYFDNLKLPDSWVLPPRVQGATYSHFAIRVPDRDGIMTRAAGVGVQLGQLIEYSMPHLSAYQEYAGDQKFPNSLRCSRSMINLPVYPDLNEKHLKRIIDSVRLG